MAIASRRVRVTFACLGAATLSLTVTFTLAGIRQIDWKQLSDIGQAFGIISTLLSAIGLLGVVASLRYQRQQTIAAQYQAVREIRTQLLQFAINNPHYLRSWGYREVHAGIDSADYAYMSLVFSYHKMAFALGALRKLELFRSCSLMFENQVAVRFWADAREVYISGDNPEDKASFSAIVDSIYNAAAQTSRPGFDTYRERAGRKIIKPSLSSKRRKVKTVLTILACGLSFYAGGTTRKIAISDRHDRRGHQCPRQPLTENYADKVRPEI